MSKAKIAALAAAAAVSAAPAARADTVERERWSEDYADAVDCSPFGYAFAIEFSGTEHIAVTTRFDDAGEVVRETIRIRFSETNTNSVTGATVPLRGSVTNTFDYVAGTQTITGVVYIGTDKGGTFVQDTGRVVFDLDTEETLALAGPHEALAAGLDPLVCAALA